MCVPVAQSISLWGLWQLRGLTTLTLGLVEFGLHWHYDSHPSPSFTSQILSLPLVVVLSLWLFTDTKYCCCPAEVYGNRNSQLVMAQWHVTVCSTRFPVALLSVLVPTLDFHQRCVGPEHSSCSCLKLQWNRAVGSVWYSLKFRPSTCLLNGWLYVKWNI